MSSTHFIAEQLPDFNLSVPELVNTLEAKLNANRVLRDSLLEESVQKASADSAEKSSSSELWQNLVQVLEEADDELEKFWAPVSHLNGVKNNEELREAYQRCLPLLSQYSTEQGQHKGLFEVFKTIKEKDWPKLDAAQQQVVKHALRNFHLSGIDLEEEKQKRYGEISEKLSGLYARFSNNVLDATQSWTLHIENEEQLNGLPETALQTLKQLAQAKELDGYLITLDFPSYLPIMTYCENREIRKQVYDAYVTRASELGPDAGKFSNDDLLVEILQLRAELSKLLGFKNYAEYSVESKMAESPQTVIDLLQQLAKKSAPIAKKEFAELEVFAKQQGAEKLEAWDVTFWSEKLKQEKYSISQEELRPYFVVDHVIQGMFDLTEKLFNVSIKENTEIKYSDTNFHTNYHPDVRFFEISRDGNLLAGFYLDLYAREQKRGGAWMADASGRRVQNDGSLQLPVAFLTCNFTPALGDKPALLTHNEITTLFHEFGHGLHHMLTKVDYGSVSGINGVEWDAVELPSQFMENWCWEKDVVQGFSGHFETGEPLPDELFEKMLAAKNFQSAMFMVRQLEFALFDFLLHQKNDIHSAEDVQQVLDQVRSEVAVVPAVDYNRFQNSFSHIFAGGYAAGYYSYKWAEVLSADAYAAFEEDGLFNPEIANSFLKNILEKGGSADALDLFVNFRGRKPTVDALLRHTGIQ